MYSLSLGDTTSPTILHGPAIVSPFRGAFFDRPGKPGDVIEDTIDLTLEANALQVQAGTSTLEIWLSKARQYANTRVGSPVYLHLKESVGELLYISPVLDGWVEKLKGIKEKGSAVYRLHVTRANYWEYDSPVSLQLSNLHGSGPAVTVTNHNDAAHSNYVEIAAAQVLSDLPCPAILRLTNTSASGACTIFYVGCHANLPETDSFPHILEGEAGAGGTPQFDMNSSGEAYTDLTWAIQTETQLLTWPLSSLLQATAQGRYYRPLVRFNTTMAYTNLWLQLRILNGSTLLWAGPWTLIPVNANLPELPSLQIPPHLAQAASFQALTLALFGRRASAGSHVLQLDYLQLTPLDAWRKYTPLGSGLAVNDLLVDDSRLGQVYQFHGTAVFAEYAAEGAPIFLQPGRRHRLYFLQQPSAIARTLLARVQVYPRYRRI